MIHKGSPSTGFIIKQGRFPFSTVPFHNPLEFLFLKFLGFLAFALGKGLVWETKEENFFFFGIVCVFSDTVDVPDDSFIVFAEVLVFCNWLFVSLVFLGDLSPNYL